VSKVWSGIFMSPTSTTTINLLLRRSVQDSELLSSKSQILLLYHSFISDKPTPGRLNY